MRYNLFISISRETESVYGNCAFGCDIYNLYRARNPRFLSGLLSIKLSGKKVMVIGQCVTLAAILLIMFKLPMAATYAALAMYAVMMISTAFFIRRPADK